MRPLSPGLPLLLVVTAVSTVSAQEFDLRRAGIPREAAAHIQRILEDPATQHFAGTASIAAGAMTDGSVVVSDGSLTIAGRIRGDVVALRADVRLEAGAVVDGEIAVVAGTLYGEDVARVGGTITVYGEGFDLWASAHRFHGERAERYTEDWWDRDEEAGADFRVRVGENYNRIEGLPVQFGPDIRTSGGWGTRVQALAVWRTAVGPLTRTEPMGYDARVEQFVGTGAFRVGAGVRSIIEPIEAWSLTNLEASLSAVLFHEDQRDYFERTGWNVYARVAPRGSPLDMTVEYREEEHQSIAARDPWTLFNGDHVWRAQPLVGEGDVSLVTGTLVWDERSDAGFNRRGWYARAQIVRAVDGTLTVPGGLTLADTPAEPIDFDATFTAGLIDVRRYQRAGPGGILGLRAVAGGALQSHALPPQYQHALGGAGTLPGYSLFSQDCGARRVPLVRDDETGGPAYFGGYGCDRFAIAQIEYRGGFDVRFGHKRGDRDGGWDSWDVDTDVDWTVFVDAGRGWALEQDRIGGRRDTGMLYDVGAGVILGGLGVYGAVPLNHEDRGLRLFVRLGPRF